MLELLNDLRDRKPFQVIYDGEDFGIYRFNEEKGRYEGVIGFIPLEEMVAIIKDKDHFIKLRRTEDV